MTDLHPASAEFLNDVIEAVGLMMDSEGDSAMRAVVERLEAFGARYGDDIKIAVVTIGMKSIECRMSANQAEANALREMCELRVVGT